MNSRQPVRGSNLRSKQLPLPRQLLLAALLIYFALLAIRYAAATPPLEAPDEGSHFLYIHNLLETGELPILEDRKTVFASQSVQRHHPPLYYLIGAVLAAGTRRDDVAAYLQVNPLASIGVVTENNRNVFLHPEPTAGGDTGCAIWLLRLFSIALGTGTIALIAGSARIITGSAGLGLLAGGLVASMPSFIHISASINNDNMVTLLQTAGVYFCLRIWKRRAIGRLDVAALCLILSGIALAKLNGLMLFPIVYGWLLFGAITRRLRWKPVFVTMGATAAAVALLAGWWYARNWQFYGDPLALAYTLRIWGRGGSPHLLTLDEAKGVWDSFWFVLGNFSIRGPDWLYSLYLPAITAAGIIGLLHTVRAKPHWRSDLLLLLVVAAGAFVTLIVSTSRVDVSQGRMLFPGLAAYAPLLVIGWAALGGRRLAGAAILPLAVISLSVPPVFLNAAFRQAETIAGLPPDAQPLDARAGPLHVLGYRVENNPIQPGDTVRLQIFISGAHPDNPYLSIKAMEPISERVLGGVDAYPGMMPTNTLAAEAIYAVPVRFSLSAAAADADARPMRLDLLLSWWVPNVDDITRSAHINMDSGGMTHGALVLTGPTLIYPNRPAVASLVNADVIYDNKIRLCGIRLSDESLAPGETLNVTLCWGYVSPMSEDWSAAIGLLDSSSGVLVQADGMPAGYPTTAWRPGPDFTDERTLQIPEEARGGDYDLYVGWYRLSDGMRLQPAGENVQGDLYIFPQSITIRGSS